VNRGRDMTCEEFVERASALALSALDDIERQACARHLAWPGMHRGCRQALAEAEAVTALLSEALPERTPPPELWRAIEDRVVRR
jgi:hypothetical protein